MLLYKLGIVTETSFVSKTHKTMVKCPSKVLLKILCSHKKQEESQIADGERPPGYNAKWKGAMWIFTEVLILLFRNILAFVMGHSFQAIPGKNNLASSLYQGVVYLCLDKKKKKSPLTLSHRMLAISISGNDLTTTWLLVMRGSLKGIWWPLSHHILQQTAFFPFTSWILSKSHSRWGFIGH